MTRQPSFLDNFYSHVVTFEKFLPHHGIWTTGYLHVPESEVEHTVEVFSQKIDYRNIRVETSK